jgi:ribosome maturation factor RimP
MDVGPLQETLLALISPLLQEECVELIESRITKSNSGTQIILLVDKPGGGITLDICAALNRRIGAVLEHKDIIDGRYILEVSSPGLDRNLLTRNDFIRCVDKQVKFFLSEPIGGKLEWDARILKADDEAVDVEAKGTLLSISYNKINKARQIL